MWRYTWWTRNKNSCVFHPGGMWTKIYYSSPVSGILYLCGVKH